MVVAIGDRPVYGRQVHRTETSAPPSHPRAREPGVRERSAGASSGTRPSDASLRGDLTMRGNYYRHLAHASAPAKPERTVNGAGEIRLLHLNQGWTPQGQGYDARRDEVLTSYYRNGSVMVSMQDRRTGKETHKIPLGGLGPNDPGGPAPAPSHGGGVSTDGEHVYVADTDRLYMYNRRDLVRAEQNGLMATPAQVIDVPKDDRHKSKGSYMTVKDGYAYVGTYSNKDDHEKPGAVWRYAVDRNTGALVESSKSGPIRAPDRAQGVMVANGALLFTTGKQKLVYQPIDPPPGPFGANTRDRVDISNGRIDPYAQGLNVINNELWVTYESGSDLYPGRVDHPRKHIQRIPLGELDTRAVPGLSPADLAG